MDAATDTASKRSQGVLSLERAELPSNLAPRNGRRSRRSSGNPATIQDVAVRNGFALMSGDDETPMAGILLYTAAADSDGTLGGLIELGTSSSLGRLIAQALHRATICSSDPLCSEHTPETDRTLHAASCHACAFVSETSCERGNRYLDRALLVPTFDSRDAAFFDQVKE